jgi:copper oxidase (laccase) domain-containing protein
VDEPVLERLQPWPWWETVVTPNAKGRWQLDLRAANERQLIDAGILPERIEVLGLCTYHHPDLFYSHRRSPITGRMAAVIAPRPARQGEIRGART